MFIPFFLQGLTNDLSNFTQYESNWLLPPSPITPKEALSNVEFCSHCTLSLLPRRSRWHLLALAGYPDENGNNLKKKIRKRVGDDGKREKTGKTVNTRNISGMLLCCKEKANQAGEN